MSGAIPNAASSAPQQPERNKSNAEMCWAGDAEIPNLTTGKHKVPTLPNELANAEVKQSTVLLKVCIGEKGDISRVLVLGSSGNSEVDNYFIKEISKWPFKPMRRANANIRSVLTVAIIVHRP